MDGWIGYTERGSGVECACRHSATNPTGHSLSLRILPSASSRRISLAQQQQTYYIV
jgi:hypothetical protein